MSDAEIREVLDETTRGYAAQIARFAAGHDRGFALTLANAEGPSRDILPRAGTR